jgi:hypothetical protein
MITNDGNKIVYMIWLEHSMGEQGLDRNNSKIEFVLLEEVNYSQWLRIVSNNSPLCASFQKKQLFHRPNKEVKLQAKQTPWPESASKLYRPSDRRLLVKLVPTFVDRRMSRSQRRGSPMVVISIF